VSGQDAALAEKWRARARQAAERARDAGLLAATQRPSGERFKLSDLWYLRDKPADQRGRP